MCKVLYIAGYGRSGSTLLDILLGGHDLAVGVGELVYLGEEWRHEERTCACGEDYEQCSFWGGAIRSRKEAAEITRLSKRVEHRRALPALLTDSVPCQVKRNYRNHMRHLFSYIAERSGAEWVVDSSKSGRHAAGRFWALQHVEELDVRVVHLVRDGRDVLNSVVEKGTNWSAEGYREEQTFRAERTVLGWVLANGLAWALGVGLDEDRYLRVRFEDLLSQPESILQKVGAFIGEDLSPVSDRISAGDSFSVGHNVGGNRLRKKEQIFLRRKENVRRQPWKELSPYHRSLFGLLGQWLNQSFGYTL